MTADSGAIEQRFGDRRRTVAKGHQADSQAPRTRIPSGTSACTGRLVKPSIMCWIASSVPRLNGRSCRVTRRGLERDPRERLAGVDGGQGETVAEKSREPGLRQVGGAPTSSNRWPIGDMFESVSLTSKISRAGRLGPSGLTG